MMNRIVRVCLSLVAFILAFLGPAESNAGEWRAALLPVADTGLYEITSTNNLGRSPEVPAGVHSSGKRSRYLVRFDPADALPTGAVVTGVELWVQVAVAGSSFHDYGVHRMLRDWVEGNQEGGNGSGAVAGETTWLAQYHPDTTWTVPGGDSGVDYAAVPSVMATLGGTGSTNYFSSPNLTADVQFWLDHPGLNFGWMIRAVDETVRQTVRRIASRETTNSPVLIVRYLPPDADGDGVMNTDDKCPDTAPGAIVDANGCSLEQFAPCNAAWANHGQYVAAFAAAVDEFVRAGLLTLPQRAAAVRHAAQSDCGR